MNSDRDHRQTKVRKILDTTGMNSDRDHHQTKVRKILDTTLPWTLPPASTPFFPNRDGKVR